MQVSSGGINRTDRIDEPVHVMMVSAECGVFLEKHCADHSGGDDATGYGKQAAFAFGTEGLVIDAGHCQTYSGQNTANDDPENEPQGHEIKCFACIGFKNVSDHARVDENAVFEHEVVGRAGDEQQQDQDWFGKVRYQKEIEEQIECSEDDDGNADAEKECGSICYRQVAKNVAPQ